MSLLSLALLGSAYAADVAAGGVAPDMNVQSFRPSTDSLHFVRMTDSAVAPAGTLGWRVTTSYAKDLLVWTDVLDRETVLVGNLVQTDIAAGWNFGRARVAVAKSGPGSVLIRRRLRPSRARWSRGRGAS